MVEINFSAYDGLSVEDLGKQMCSLKEICRLHRIEIPEINCVEVSGRFIPAGLDTPSIFHYVGRNGEYDSLSFDEATDILKKEKDLKTDRYLVSKGISRQDVKGFLEYLAMSVSLEKKEHPELYEKTQ